MSKSLKSMSPGEAATTIKRRIEEKAGGNGYWAAKDALKKIKINVKNNSDSDNNSDEDNEGRNKDS